MNEGFFNRRAIFQKVLCLLFRAKAHHPFDQRAVVPAAVEEHYFTGRRKMRDVALDIDLGFFAFGRSRQCDDSEHARADSLGDAFDHAAFSGGIASFEQNDNFRAGMLHPLLEFHQFDVEGF